MALFFKRFSVNIHVDVTFVSHIFLKKKMYITFVCVIFCDIRIEKLEAGEGDEWAFLEWQARMRKLDHDKELEEFERRWLAGLLSQEESVIARQKLIKHKKNQVAEMKAEVA